MATVKPIRSYREQAGLSQADLGERLGVTRQTIAAWENGEREPSVAQLLQIARALALSADLLLGVLEPTAEPAAAGLMFRADNPAALEPRLRAALAQKAADYAEIETLVQAVPTLPALRPLAGYDEQVVEEVAREIRDWLGLNETCPLGDVLALLESKGIKVILHPLPPEVSGFSAYTETTGAALFINAAHPTERQFFTALHELAHLIFHRCEYRQANEKASRGDPREKAANHFAGAVLLPEEAVRCELRPYRDRWLPEPLLGDIKQRYGVSLRTAIYRAAQTGLITRKQQGQQIGCLNKKYGPEQEPPQFALPQPQHLTRLERLVYCALLREVITSSRAAEILGQPLFEVRDTLNCWQSESQA